MLSIEHDCTDLRTCVHMLHLEDNILSVPLRSRHCVHVIQWLLIFHISIQDLDLAVVDILKRPHIQRDDSGAFMRGLHRGDGHLNAAIWTEIPRKTEICVRLGWSIRSTISTCLGIGANTFISSLPWIHVTFSTGTYTFKLPVRMHIESMSSVILCWLSERSFDWRFGFGWLTIARYYFVIAPFIRQRRRNVCFVPDGAAVTVGIVCLEVVWIECCACERVSHDDCYSQQALVDILV